ncbi:MAG: response regulator [Candidatus Sumerlaeaceae bacterium]|nr:response regulator [Candidatus Sumerlaeaceae bacterium]
MNNETTPKSVQRRVLIVDDNKIYREALRRRLMLRQCDVLEAHDMEDALERIEIDSPEIVITDLQMRTDTEGLELIRQIKSQFPLLPVIMISAVGTFEDGALAQRYGASSVIAKGRIEEEMEEIFRAIDRAHEEYRRNEELRQQLRVAAETIDYRPEEEVREVRDFLVKLLSEQNIPPTLRAEAYNLYVRANTERLREESRAAVEQSGLILTKEVVEEIERLLREALPCYADLDEDAKESLQCAEFLLREQMRRKQSLDLSRMVGFSYCFAVESEAKKKLQKRITRLLQKPETYALIEEFLEGPQRRLSVHLRQHILVLMRGREWDVTTDNVRQTLHRMLEHQERYKPDGLKALGIIVLLFGREYVIVGSRSPKVTVSNPLQLKGLEKDDQVIRFAELLVQLQHYRNPYIHPEISELEKVSVLRKKAFECLTIASQLT